ncbi:MAG: hypothetical protein QOI08_2988 [Actinomycetota bacterium]|nr:hypothetical protein [Actinomycetota bacterium]
MTKTAELIITRIYNAPRELLFACMTEPEHLTHFWGPVGVTTPVDNIKVDLRVGGVFETIMVNDATGDQYHSRGIYTEIDPPETLSWQEADGGMTTTSTFVDLGDGRTEVRIQQTNVPEMYATPESQAGFNSSLDRFERYITEIS